MNFVHIKSVYSSSNGTILSINVSRRLIPLLEYFAVNFTVGWDSNNKVLVTI